MGEKVFEGVHSMYERFFKRVIDIVLSVIGIIICLIPMIITAIAIKIDSPGPVLFKQERLGLKGKVFRIYKFRSMCQGAEHTGTGVYSGADDMRVTRVGKIIRATSIDELPQLFNIIKGDMSFIGERDIIVTTKKNIVFSRVVAANSVSL